MSHLRWGRLKVSISIPCKSECGKYVISSDLKVCQYFCQYGEALHQRLLFSTLFGIELSAEGKKGICLELKTNFGADRGVCGRRAELLHWCAKGGKMHLGYVLLVGIQHCLALIGVET